ncbi:hypothetical protein SAMN04487895_10341 [Paenibacillus sophorae]|uniref:Uncharacterized protein n=1 Tax=Paenibacillus sophorae TaxID=1333845 RepID=A0A1H8JIJ9_9BACL|nr:hypothetical protein [Paenibacillus sophorae]QWU13377.1 hypothetical protein KP014_15355 [Paenibacillus sophorae]SEN80634.1 hypothetical protein SAMN04487895_10341 [Paenibacillus sophorae]
MSLEPILFMIFSSIETFSLYFMIMCLFRFKWKKHAWQALFIILPLNLQSYLLRNDLDMGNIASLVLIIVFIIFFTSVVKMPIIISMMATILGFIIFALIQSAFMLSIFGSQSAIENSHINGYLLQLITATFNFLFFYFIYLKGKGFTFDIEKLRFKIEDIILLVLIIAFLLGISVLLYFKEIYLHILFFVPISAFLLYYSRKREHEND